MTQSEHHTKTESFDELRKQIDADPDRRVRVEDHKAAMLADLRRELDLTQAAVAERLEVTQENVSQIERGEADVRLSTLNRYVEALGGRLEVRAAFPDHSVELKVGKHGEFRRRRGQAKAS
jgi:transcriptional regulator with XRE-family HTH domain